MRRTLRFAACSYRWQAAWCGLFGLETIESGKHQTFFAVAGLNSALASWLRDFHDDAEKARVMEIGLLTGLKEEAGRYFPANFERGLLLREIVRRLKPKRILELGTGRGLGVLCMADQVQSLDYTAELVSVDIIPPSRKAELAHLPGRPVRHAIPIHRRGLEPELRSTEPLITLRTGATTATLPAMVKDGRKFDFIFIDAGHDVYSVFHDFAYSCLLLSEDGEILMDDFAPTEPFGLGTCIVAAHATRVFEQVEAIESNGLVFEPDYAGFTRGMVHLAGMKRGRLELDPVSLLAVRVLGKAVEGLFHPKVLPIRIS